ncbi:Tn3 family transposase [Streptomyces sp. SID4950]|nr:Tn3 family transposase [Streptomyces sp. SID4950]
MEKASRLCHGKRGTIHQAYRDGMEDQLGALGLVLSDIVLWTTKYTDASVEALRAEGHEIRDEDFARLSPLKHRNLNLLGRWLPAPAARSGRARTGRGRRGWRGLTGVRKRRGRRSACERRPWSAVSRRWPSAPGGPQRDRGALDRLDVLGVEPLVAHLPDEAGEVLSLRLSVRFKIVP